MIFESDFLEKVQRAIDQRDRDFFLSYLKPKKREVRDVHFHSALMISAHRAKHLNKLDEIKADAAIINLEDGVAPELKEIALLAAALFIQEAPLNAPLLVVRINPLEESGLKEIAFLNDFFPDAIRIPKLRSYQELLLAQRHIKEPIAIHASIETKEAFSGLRTLQCSRLRAVYLGILDLLADLHIPQKVLKLSNPVIDYILSRFLVESRALGVLPVSFVYQEYQNLEEFEEWCKKEADMGFSAKGCISPAQVEIVNRIFRSADLERARYIKERFEAMAAQGITGFSDERYGFIDEPIYKDALNILGNRT